MNPDRLFWTAVALLAVTCLAVWFPAVFGLLVVGLLVVVVTSGVQGFFAR